MDSLERARRALARLPNSTPAPPGLVNDVADAIRGAVRAALLDASQQVSSRVYANVPLDVSKIRRAEADEIAAVLEKQGTSYR